MKSKFLQQLRAAFDRYELDSAARTDRGGPLVQRIQKAAHRFGIYPSRSQILELQCSDFPASLKAALRASRSRQSRTNGCGLGGGFSFELFCVLVGCLKNRRKKSRFSIGASAPAGGPSVAYRRRSSVGVGFGRWRRPSLRRGVVVVGGGGGGRPLLSDEPRCSVFLGGACNPTTWRSDTAVPFLVKERISFYNPQVDSWYPQLIDIENTAKDNASVLLFVLDPRTRGIASIVESAYLAGQGRNLVLVIPDACTTGKSRIANCRWEQESIHRSLLFLIDLVERCQIPVFDSLPAALQAVKTLVKQRQSVTKLSPDDGVSPVWDSAAPVSRTLTLLWELFRCHDTGRTGRISADAAGLILETMSGGVGGGVIGRRRNDCDSFDMSVLPEPGQAVSFADLCLLYSSESGREDWTDWLWSALAWPLAFAKRLLTGPASALSAAAPIYDVFLGGTCGRSRWRDDAAIPRLQAAGISYYNPQVSNWSSRFLSYESGARDQSLVLLFVITCDSWSTAAMLEAAHFIGRCGRVVLHVQLYPAGGGGGDGDGCDLSADAVKDYNRGRLYLLDVANRANVPVLASPEEAVDKVIGLVTQLRGVS
ncbi:hypothetical protein BOX15_Mlig020189g2 [Macrostomum lignano]|uniref:Uncharacterized protein n=1 Tax=Macrostomum lignano TaxID=282301 RepID=A0A267DZP7_9PLAT|nr:hypothetical protein BOX15_Mlig020189g2 [Macrostomum lignano]